MLSKKIRSFAIICVTSLFMCSCAMHGGYVTNSAALNTNNFTYVEKSASGVAEATYIFGIGGLDRNALVEEARSNLIDRCDLKDNQTFVNTTVSFKMTFVLPFFMKNKCTVSASVVEFYSDGVKPNPANQSGKKKSGITMDELRIDSLRSKQVAFIKYSTISEVKQGDAVVFNTIYGDRVFGIIQEINKRTVRIKTFPTPGIVRYENIRWKEIQKLITK